MSANLWHVCVQRMNANLWQGLALAAHTEVK